MAAFESNVQIPNFRQELHIHTLLNLPNAIFKNRADPNNIETITKIIHQRTGSSHFAFFIGETFTVYYTYLLDNTLEPGQNPQTEAAESFTDTHNVAYNATDIETYITVLIKYHRKYCELIDKKYENQTANKPKVHIYVYQNNEHKKLDPASLGMLRFFNQNRQYNKHQIVWIKSYNTKTRRKPYEAKENLDSLFKTTIDVLCVNLLDANEIDVRTSQTGSINPQQNGHIQEKVYNANAIQYFNRIIDSLDQSRIQGSDIHLDHEASTANRLHTVHRIYMMLAFAIAHKIGRQFKPPYESKGGYPIAALLVGPDGTILSWAVNTSQENYYYHAEINVLHAYFQRTQKPIPAGSSIYTTLQPCQMCAGMIMHAYNSVDTIEGEIWKKCDPAGKLNVYYGQSDHAATNSALNYTTDRHPVFKQTQNRCESYYGHPLGQNVNIDDKRFKFIKVELQEDMFKHLKNGVGLDICQHNGYVNSAFNPLESLNKGQQHRVYMNNILENGSTTRYYSGIVNQLRDNELHRSVFGQVCQQLDDKYAKYHTVDNHEEYQERNPKVFAVITVVNEFIRHIEKSILAAQPPQRQANSLAGTRLTRANERDTKRRKLGQR